MDLDKQLDQAATQLKFIDSVSLHHFCSRNPTLRLTTTAQDRERSLKFGPEKIMNLNPPSSEEDSDPETKLPSVYQVIEKILDTEHTNITDEPLPTQFHSPTLIICGLDPRVRSGTITESINSLSQGIRKIALVEFGEEPLVYTALVVFETMVAGNFHSAKDLYRKLRKYEKAQILGSKVHQIPGAIFATTVRWFSYKVLDPSLDWTAVVLRKLTLYKTSKEIQKRLGKYCIRVETPRIINTQLCTLVVVPSLIEGKKIIANLKNFGLAELGDLHPYSSCFKKPDSVVSLIYKDFFRVENFSFVSNLHESEEDVISSISSSEEGEITNGDTANHSPCYEVMEFPGAYVTRNKQTSFHSGVYVKTTFNARLQNN